MTWFSQSDNIEEVCAQAAEQCYHVPAIFHAMAAPLNMDERDQLLAQLQSLDDVLLSPISVPGTDGSGVLSLEDGMLPDLLDLDELAELNAAVRAAAAAGDALAIEARRGEEALLLQHRGQAEPREQQADAHGASEAAYGQQHVPAGSQANGVDGAIAGGASTAEDGSEGDSIAGSEDENDTEHDEEDEEERRHAAVEMGEAGHPTSSSANRNSSEVVWYSRRGQVKTVTQGANVRGTYYGVCGEYAIIRVRRVQGAQKTRGEVLMRRSKARTKSVLGKSASLFTRLSRMRSEITELEDVSEEVRSESIANINNLLGLWGMQRNAARINLRMMQIDKP